MEPVKCEKKFLKLSWSRLRTHSECKQRGYLMSTGKKATLDDTRNFFPGTVTDRVVRDWLLNDPAKNKGLMPQMVAEIMERERDKIHESGGVMRWRDAGDREQVLKDCTEAVTKIEPHLERLVLPYQYQPDFRFEAPWNIPHPDGGMETIQLIGFMDIIVKDDNENFQVYDVKHTRDAQYWRKTVGQLGFYDFATFLTFGKYATTTGLLQPLCPNPTVEYNPTEESRAKLMNDIMRLAKDIWTNDTTPRNDTKLCGYCPVKHACEKFKPVGSNGRRRVSLI